jgi:hypothetical protein
LRQNSNFLRGTFTSQLGLGSKGEDRKVKGMKLKTVFLFLVLASPLVLSTPLFAHHGYAAYDMQSVRSLKGTVTNWLIMNPHSQMTLDVKNADGIVEHWVIEDIGGARGMKERGWDTLHPGDEITLYYHPVRGEGHAGLLIRVAFPDGRVLPRPQQPSDDPQHGYGTQ